MYGELYGYYYGYNDIKKNNDKFYWEQDVLISTIYKIDKNNVRTDLFKSISRIKTAMFVDKLIDDADQQNQIAEFTFLRLSH